MGVRTQVRVIDGDSNVYLYAHWVKYDSLVNVTKTAIKRVPGRHADGSYLTRAIFSQMLALDSNLLNETGFGIASTSLTDDESTIVVNVDRQTVTYLQREREVTVKFSSIFKE